MAGDSIKIDKSSPVIILCTDLHLHLLSALFLSVITVDISKDQMIKLAQLLRYLWLERFTLHQAMGITIELGTN
ncbi:Protein of unknown function [Pyronema omphalodes CBS 100304]|uniref:Uncharacterized protein n=1 Tax=Pyronema omphalodes (strain CBS 100304) TaxID=1076935 RepID=U4LTG8_PYROM|nr:Protein of unknown function [Pyronema omphalodes CBS 100304]